MLFLYLGTNLLKIFEINFYNFFFTRYYWLIDSYPPKSCDSIFICLLMGFDKSFKTDGGLGGYLNPVTHDNSISYFLLRFFFDNICFILMMIILLNILLGFNLVLINLI